jgi:hypothetical protein
MLVMLQTIYEAAGEGDGDGRMKTRCDEEGHTYIHTHIFAKQNEWRRITSAYDSKWD